MKKIIVMGVGNYILTDEGIGIHVIKELETSPVITSPSLQYALTSIPSDLLILNNVTICYFPFLKKVFSFLKSIDESGITSGVLPCLKSITLPPNPSRVIL